MWKNVVAPTLLVIIFWGLSNVATAFYIRWLERVPERMIMEDLSTIHAADAMRHDLGEINRAMARAEHPISQQTRAQVLAIENQFLRDLDEAIATANSPLENSTDKRIRERFDEYRAEVHRQLDDPSVAASDNLKKLLLSAGAVSAEEIKLGEENEREMKTLAESRALSSSSLSRIRYSLLIVGPIAGIACGFWISRRFHRSISRISIVLDDVTSEMRERVGRVEVTEAGSLPRLHEQVGLVVNRIRDVVQQLNEARQKAIGAARLAAVGEMAAGVAHELRNPLTSVKLLIQNGAQRSDRSLTEKQFRVVLEEISRMETTIEQMLDFARPPTINRGRHDLREIALHALSANEGRALHAKVSFANEIPETPAEVNGDAEQLQQVFGNLIQNGIEAMPAGGVLHVRIAVDRTTRRCRVLFSDDGPGISPPVMARLFEPFVTDKARGTGLGLAVSHRIVRDHHGVLTAANRPEGGAEFTVELPCECSGEAHIQAVPAFAADQRDVKLPESIRSRTAGMHA